MIIKICNFAFLEILMIYEQKFLYFHILVVDSTNVKFILKLNIIHIIFSPWMSSRK